MFQIDAWQKRALGAEAELGEARKAMGQAGQERAALERKVREAQQKLARCQQELLDERSINQACQGDQQAWLERTARLERRLDELQRTKDAVSSFFGYLFQKLVFWRK